MERFDLNTCKRVNEWLRKDVKRIVIIPHVNPDGDAIGSALGLNDVFNNAGFESGVIVPNDFPVYLNWLGSEGIPLIYEQNSEQCHQMIDKADALFFLDFNDVKRLGKLEEYLSTNTKKVVLIDHHPDPQIKADFMFSDTNVSSTAELVYDFVEAMDMLDHLGVNGANALLTGIIADTGSFSHNSSRPPMYRIVGELINKGADKEKINESLYNNFSEKRMRLLGYCLSEKMEVYPQYRTALIWLSAEELKRFDFHPGDTEGFVNYPLSVKGVVFSAFFMEKHDQVKISFRSKGSFATNDFSGVHFSGGGHRNASGGETKLSMEKALELFRELLPQYSEQLEKDC
ncbi:MAG TPA: bifunctional oligoribonuclease/PAP phosphatase NrnA [Prolixibacteraceae bacterium]